jgi:pimeloyl-ACP methyl ester carboxylesterase
MSETTVKNQAPAAVQDRYLTGSIASRDGTTISYRQLGNGPGVVVLHGAMESAQSHMQLAEALAATFTIYLPERRGRGLSGPYGDDYGIQKNVEDMDALLNQTGAHLVFGVSSGAIICLQAALTLPAIQKAAIFEPPLLINGSPSTSFLTRYDSEIAEGKVASALVTGMIGSQMGPPVFNVMPRWLLERLTQMMMAS